MISNYLSKAQRRVALTIVLIVTVLLTAFFLTNILLYSSARLVIEGVHNPASTSVYVKDKKLFPAGKDGRTYVFHGRTGSYTASIVGPGIKPVNIPFDVRSFSVTNTSAKTSAWLSGEVAESIIQPIGGDSITSVLPFGSADWLVAQLENKAAGSDRKLFVMHYDVDKRLWRVVASGVKIDLDDAISSEAPEQLLDYLSVAGGD